MKKRVYFFLIFFLSSLASAEFNDFITHIYHPFNIDNFIAISIICLFAVKIN